MVALTLPLPTKATSAEKTLKNTNSSRKFGFYHQDTSLSTETVKKRLKNFDWEGVIGVTDTYYNCNEL